MVFNNLGHVIDQYMLLDCFNKLDGKKAVGIDRMSKGDFGDDLASNLDELLISMRRGTYQPRPARIVEIPKEDGSKRPLAISCFGDKVIQLAAARILTAIFEPLFLEGSYGYRPGRNAHQALSCLMQAQSSCVNGAVVEIDLQKYFQSVPHEQLLKFLKQKISDNRFLGLIVKLMTGEILDATGKSKKPYEGVPQGSILSPVLSNIYLHYVLDKWHEELRKNYFRHATFQVRFADDCAWVFANRDEAEKFARTLPKRLEKYGLKMNEAKSSIQTCGKYGVGRELLQGKPMPQFKFLGFQCQWLPSQKGVLRPRVRPRNDRMQSTLKRVREYLRKNLNHPNHNVVLRNVSLVYSGWLRYFAVSDCHKYLWAFRHELRITIHRWFNRRGKRGSMNWSKLDKILQVNRINQIPKLKSLWTHKSTEQRQNWGA